MGCLKLTYREHESPLRVIYRKGQLRGKSVQRCLSTDPLAADYMAWSTYNYVMGNPIMLVDPTGKSSEKCDTCPKDDPDYDWAREDSREYKYDKESGELSEVIEYPTIDINDKPKTQGASIGPAKNKSGLSIENSSQNGSGKETLTADEKISLALVVAGSASSTVKGYNNNLIGKGKMINTNQLLKGKFVTNNLYRSNGRLNGNKYISASRYLASSKTIAKAVPLINVIGLGHDLTSAYKHGRLAYASRGIASFVTGYVPYIGTPAAIAISQQPLRDFEQPSNFRGGGVCFVQGTKIWSEKGLVNIETLSAGDKAFSLDLKNNRLELQKIVFYKKDQCDATIAILTTDSITIKSTIKHPYFVIDQGWIPANKLSIGDTLRNAKGSIIEIENIESNTLENTQIYNFQVNKNNNYFVSPNKILVHNKSYLPNFIDEKKKDGND